MRADDRITVYYYPVTQYAPLNSDQFLSKTKDEAIELFHKNGLYRLKTEMIEGGGGLFKKKHLIEHIDFCGKTTFETYDFVRDDCEITIYYYSR